MKYYNINKNEVPFLQAQWTKMTPYFNALDKYRNQKDFGIPTDISDEEAKNIALELQSLRDKVDGDAL